MKDQVELVSGNRAVARGALDAGCRMYFGYPITPQTEIAEYMSMVLPEMNGVFLQAESELAAINMVYVAAGAGRRVMTTSSSPGISLMMEGLSYLSTAELPCVIVNVMRGGPGLGNISPAQGDYFQAVKGGGHGDYRTPVLAPWSVQESYDLTRTAFDLADRWRNPVFILLDGLLGTMMEPLQAREPIPERAAPSWATTGMFAREPGDRAPRSIYTLHMPEGALTEVNRRLQAKYQEITREEVRYDEHFTEDAEVVVVAYGSVARSALQAVRIARQQGRKAGLFRPVTLWPFPEEALGSLSEKVEKILVAEMSSGQMLEDVRLAAAPSCKIDFLGAMGGELIYPGTILARLLEE